MITWIQNLQLLPFNYYEVHYQRKKYGVTKIAFSNGKSVKVYAEQLGGKDFISFNCYFTSCNILLKPCEMDERKVIHFLEYFTSLLRENLLEQKKN